ncbi:MAG: glycogen synthase GlgA [Opitutaceae bacterium]|jgi:starch synthase|nr:glycogen synthase GlgA [Opitutaceae bacterium]
MNALKILFVSPEVDPFVKVGGLADMAGSLPKGLAALGHDVRVVCPYYGLARERPGWTALEETLGVDVGPRALWARTWRTTLPGSRVPVYLIEHDAFFARGGVYDGPWGPHGDNDLRFAFLCRAALALCQQLRWIPDVAHGHDWTTGLLPVLLNTTLRATELGRVASVFTIHNLEHQGYANPRVLDFARIPRSEFRPDSVESFGSVNMMKAGLYHSTKLTTVSPTYAREIRTPEGGWGLDPVLRFRGGDLIGILNGIDTTVWNPATDRLLAARYDEGDLRGKALCKAALREETGLAADADAPVFGVVSRLASQKGLDLLAAALPRVMEEMRVQFVILGTGDAGLQDAFSGLAARHRGRLAARIGYSNELSHRIQAGSDFFVMPSRAEPCGLTQMYAMNYGTPPIVRATGGLADTVEQYAEGKGLGTGFLFGEASARALYYTIGWACSTFYDRPADLAALRANGMRKDFSWNRSAERYEEVYRWAVEARRRA